MRFLVFFFIIQFFPTPSKGQKVLNLGEVSYDSLFNCNDSLRRRLNERLIYNLPSICESTNDIEIRLNGFSNPRTNREFIIISYKDGKWNAIKYMSKQGMTGRKLTIISMPNFPYDSVMTDDAFRHILNHLITNKIFLIPDQSKSIPDGYKGHGMYLTLSYKTQDVFRRYSFQHPDVYFQEHPGNTKDEYLCLKEIIKTLEEIFD